MSETWGAGRMGGARGLGAPRSVACVCVDWRRGAACNAMPTGLLAARAHPPPPSAPPLHSHHPPACLHPPDYVMVLAYCIISPIILPFGLLYFLGLWMVWRYQQLYVYQRQYESGGQMWPPVAHKARAAAGCVCGGGGGRDEGGTRGRARAQALVQPPARTRLGLLLTPLPPTTTPHTRTTGGGLPAANGHLHWPGVPGQGGVRPGRHLARHPPPHAAAV